MTKVMTFNVQNDSFKKKDIYSWRKRFEAIVSVIKSENPDIIGLQELTVSLRQKLKKELSNYNFYGQHRFIFFDEATAILVKKDFKVENAHTFYISKLAFKIPRIATYLKVYIQGEGIHLFNTHLDNKNKENRLYQLAQLEQRINKYKDDSLIIMGDFNMVADDLKKFVADNQLIDLASLNINKTLRKGKQQSAIDHILTTKNFVVANVFVHQERSNDVYPSDHYPVVANLKI